MSLSTCFGAFLDLTDLINLYSEPKMTNRHSIDHDNMISERTLGINDLKAMNIGGAKPELLQQLVRVQAQQHGKLYKSKQRQWRQWGMGIPKDCESADTWNPKTSSNKSRYAKSKALPFATVIVIQIISSSENASTNCGVQAFLFDSASGWGRKEENSEVCNNASRHGLNKMVWRRKNSWTKPPDSSTGSETW